MNNLIKFNTINSELFWTMFSKVQVQVFQSAKTMLNDRMTHIQVQAGNIPKSEQLKTWYSFNELYLIFNGLGKKL